VNSNDISNFAAHVDDAEMRPLELGGRGQTPKFVGAFFHAVDRGFQAAFGPFVKTDVVAPNDADHSPDSSISDLLNIREGFLLA
jgi:hypothetical protein